tara:strand:- start:1210 stop:2085 length:876 start_codon:yes stop_codon:yes gene_type:complete
MISILIPCYDFNALPLVKRLEKEALTLSIAYEIICIDDGSFSPLNENNQQINALTNCLFIESKKNVGRIANRKLLSDKAQYNWLLFIDVDTMPKNEKFLETYLSHINKKDAVFGGFFYNKESFSNDNSLRFTFGKKREQVTSKKRMRNPYKYIISSNYMINKSIFDQIEVPEDINGYGLDYFFGAQLKTNNVHITHIDNEVIHHDLDDNNEFLEKTRSALDNLKYMNNNNYIKKHDISILKAYNFLKILLLENMFYAMIKTVNNKIETNLMSKKPSLVAFDLYRLAYLCKD